MLRRAVSLSDGAVRPLTPVRLPPGDAPQAVGRHLLSPRPRRSTATDACTLYDGLAGKDVWSLPVAAGQHVARSEVPYLTATVARDGKVCVYDLRRREELFKAEVDPDDLRGVTDVRLFQDRWHYYLLLNRDLRARDGLAGPGDAERGQRGALPAGARPTLRLPPRRLAALGQRGEGATPDPRAHRRLAAAAVQRDRPAEQTRARRRRCSPWRASTSPRASPNGGRSGSTRRSPAPSTWCKSTRRQGRSTWSRGTRRCGTRSRISRKRRFATRRRPRPSPRAAPRGP